MEGMPAPCFRGVQAGRYVKRHNPFAYYVDVASSASRCRRVVPLTQLSSDLAKRAVPRFVWITPDLCHDMHSCPIGDGDRFLAGLVPTLQRAVGARGAIVITWDEGADHAGCCLHAAGGQIPTIVAGPAARAGARSFVAYDHYSLLRTIEDAFGLPHLRGAACPCTRPLSARRRRRRPWVALVVVLLAAGAAAAFWRLHGHGARPAPAAVRAPSRKPGGRGPVPVRAPVRPLRLLSGSPALESRRFTPPLRARSAILVDATTGRVLWALHPHRRRPIASTTKIMTGLLALKRLPLHGLVTVDPAATRVPLVKEGLRPRERVRVWKLLYSLLLYSGNDDASALAIAAGGSRRGFLLLMNADTWPLPHAVERLVELAEGEPRAGVVGPRLLNPDGTLQPSVRGFPTLWRLTTEYSQGKP